MSSHVDFKDAPAEGGVDPNHPCAGHLKVLDADAGLIERVRDKLAIVGYASSSRDLAPFDDPTWDICGLNQIYRFLPREDIHADIHENWEEDNVDGTDHRGWIRDCGIPVLMTKRHDDLPTSARFPIEDCIGLAHDYFTSTIALLLAFGIRQGYKEIGLYGIDLVVGTEYEVQKACAEFWIGVAHGRGIEVHLPANCALLKHSHRYGYQRQPDWGPLSLGEMNLRITELSKSRDEQLSKLHALDGAIHEVTTTATWQADVDGRVAWLRDRHREAMAMLGTLDGALQEITHWKELLTLRSRGADVRLRHP